MKKISVVFVLALAVLPLGAQEAQTENDYYTGYEGLVLGESAPRSATDAIVQQAVQTPGDIYRGTVFGAEKKEYYGDVLGNRPRATKKYLYDTSLVHAIKVGDFDRVRTLLYANVSSEEKNYAGISPITIAAEKGDLDIVTMLVVEGKVNVNDKSSYGITPLIAAAAAGNEDVVDYLIEQGADVTAKDDLGKSAFAYAVATDNPKLVAKLMALDKKAVDMPDNNGNTPLIYAAQQGLNANIKQLLAAGAKPYFRNPATGLTPIAAAAAEGHSDTIRQLVKNGHVDVNSADLSGRTPIFYAVEQNQPDALRTLIALGADVNAQDETGVTPLMRATAKDYADCVKILLKNKKINPYLTDKEGRSALTYSAYAPGIASAKLLIAAGANPNALDNTNNTPLMNAIKAKNNHAALYFIQQGTDLTVANTSGKNAFMLANEYMPESSTAQVLDIKQAAVYQQALQIQAQKLAEVRTLEEELAEQNAIVTELLAEKDAQAKAEAKEKAIALRAQMEEEYQARAAMLDDDPELQRLQQQLEAAKAKKTAALQQELDREIALKIGQPVPAPSVLQEEAAEATTKAKQTVTKAKTSARKKTAAAKTAAKKKTAAVKTAAQNTLDAAQTTVDVTVSDIL